MVKRIKQWYSQTPFAKKSLEQKYDECSTILLISLFIWGIYGIFDLHHLPSNFLKGFIFILGFMPMLSWLEVFYEIRDKGKITKQKLLDKVAVIILLMSMIEILKTPIGEILTSFLVEHPYGVMGVISGLYVLNSYMKSIDLASKIIRYSEKRNLSKSN